MAELAHRNAGKTKTSLRHPPVAQRSPGARLCACAGPGTRGEDQPCPGLVLQPCFGEQLLPICHSCVRARPAGRPGISCCGCRSLSVSSRWVCAAFLSSPSRLSSFKHFPVCQAKYACHVGAQPWDTHQLLFVFLSPLTDVAIFPVFLKPPRPFTRPPPPRCPGLWIVGAQELPFDLGASPPLCFTSSRPALRSPPGSPGPVRLSLFPVIASAAVAALS